MYVYRSKRNFRPSAPITQLFVVVHDDGWVTREDQKRINIKVGEIAFWEKEEWHTLGSDSGIKVINIIKIA